MSPVTACYIPPQTGLSAAAATPRARENPLALAWGDIRTLFSVLYLLPKLCQPFASKNETDELSLRWSNVWYLGTLVSITVLEAFLLLSSSAVWLLLPGWLNLVIFAAMLGTVWVLCAPLRGPVVVESRVGLGTGTGRNEHSDERWVFVNGVMVGNHGLQNNCDRLSWTFGRVITGIHNPTNGLVWDLLECIFQRSFSYNTYPTRYTYDHVKRYLTDPGVRKVVLIGHSQGGIIVSMTLDMLFTDLPVENIAKLEVYTFGSAASHFNNPLRAVDPNCNPKSKQRAQVIKYIEHYVNGEDMVPRWGVLHNVRCVRTRYSGKVFIRNNATGHMFNQHYLNSIFRLENSSSEYLNAEGDKGFLDQEVTVDECTCRERKVYTVAASTTGAGSSTAGAKASTIMEGASAESTIAEGTTTSDATVEGGAMSGQGNGGSPLLVDTVADGVGILPMSDGVVYADDEDDETAATGMTVRQLSRLWRYLGGADADADANGTEDKGGRITMN
ncbi:hypothetical protein AJ79_08196 [Helicocarpus griseus UAMH5409]|uniref:Uncharacterized protein n=1 Tax=Helicocarpus griseus UAMH5409 TaxID=1447875 RepID=A0A2B7WV04_9EURO|nr:hypothetical protein AJ79_08196 [Helicocarpus griseus UAMH5409]